jgi:glycosyltransferase involved in cell wall biosynthesis
MTTPLVSAILPVFNKRALLRPSLDSIVRAARRSGCVELIAVDHSSTDGSYELLQEYAGAATILRLSGGTISSVRNHGAAHARGRFLSFLDCDCVIPPDYFLTLPQVFEATGAAAVGCECDVPTPAHWTEKSWYELHVVRADGDRHYLNSANFAVRREVFATLGGFDEALPVAEDTDICSRLVAAGHRIHETQRLNVVHLGNPKSVRHFFGKQIWHGMAVLSGGASMLRNKASLMVFGHLAAVVVALALVAWPGRLDLVTRLAGALALVLLVPGITVVYRFLETRRVRAPVAAMALYTLFYFARATAVVSIVTGRGSRWLRRA